jgi:hypothetical protein
VSPCPVSAGGPGAVAAQRPAVRPSLTVDAARCGVKRSVGEFSHWQPGQGKHPRPFPVALASTGPSRHGRRRYRGAMGILILPGLDDAPRKLRPAAHPRGRDCGRMMLCAEGQRSRGRNGRPQCGEQDRRPVAPAAHWRHHT